MYRRHLNGSQRIKKGGLLINTPEISEREFAFMQAMNRMRRIRLDKLHPSLSPPEGELLGCIRNTEAGLTVSELSREMNMPMPAVSRLMRGLEAHGMIRRQILPSDRRSIVVTITQEGAQAFDETAARLHEFFSRIFCTIDPEQFGQMLDSWNLLMDHMEIQLAESLAERKIEQQSQPD